MPALPVERATSRGNSTIRCSRSAGRELWRRKAMRAIPRKCDRAHDHGGSCNGLLAAVTWGFPILLPHRCATYPPHDRCEADIIWERPVWHWHQWKKQAAVRPAAAGLFRSVPKGLRGRDRRVFRQDHGRLRLPASVVERGHSLKPIRRWRP